MTYLAACLIYKDEAPYLREWLEFHSLVGVEHFFLYDNGSSDDHRAVLAPYLERGIVSLKDWPGLGRQVEAYNDCLTEHRDVRWLAVIDADEFLFSPGGRPIPHVLRDYEEFPALGVNLAQFGTSGHETPPEGLVIENYLERSMNPKINWVKCVVHPARTHRCTGAHTFEYESGHAVDVMKRPLDGWRSESFTQSRLRINHYYTKSWAELEHKYATPRADFGDLRPPLDRELARRMNARMMPDDKILRYLPALKERLAG